jgi:hypothetical protein
MSKYDFSDFDNEVGSSPEIKTVASRPATPDVISSEEPSLPEEKETGNLEGLLLSGLEGATFGFSDEIVGGLDATLAALTGGDFSKTYEKTRDEAREIMKRNQEDNPIISTVGDFAGSLLVPAGAIGKVAKGSGAAARIGKMALAGGVGGAAIGAGKSEQVLPEEIAKDAAEGAAIGAVLGPALDGLVSTGKAIVGKGKDFYSNNQSIRRLREAYQAGKTNPEISTVEGRTKVVNELGEAIQEKLLPFADDKIEKAGQAQYEKAKAAVGDKVITGDEAVEVAGKAINPEDFQGSDSGRFVLTRLMKDLGQFVGAKPRDKEAAARAMGIGVDELEGKIVQAKAQEEAREAALAQQNKLLERAAKEEEKLARKATVEAPRVQAQRRALEKASEETQEKMLTKVRDIEEDTAKRIARLQKEKEEVMNLKAAMENKLGLITDSTKRAAIANKNTEEISKRLAKLDEKTAQLVEDSQTRISRLLREKDTKASEFSSKIQGLDDKLSEMGKPPKVDIPDVKIPDAPEQAYNDIVSQIKPTSSVDEIFQLRMQAQSHIDKLQGDPVNRDAVGSLLKLKGSLDGVLKDKFGLPVDELAKQYSTASDFKAKLGVDIGSKLDLQARKNTIEQGRNKILDKMLEASEDPSSEAAINLSRSFDDLRKSGLFGADEINSIQKELGDKAQLARVVKDTYTQLGFPGGARDFVQTGGLGIRSMLSTGLVEAGKTSKALGDVANKVKAPMYKMSTDIMNASPETIKQIASTLKGAARVQMERIANEPAAKRKALLFTLMQQPSFRQAMEGNEDE